MTWLELTLTIPADTLAQAEALLELAGAESIAISNDGDDPILEPEPGTVPLWPTLTIRALFDPGVDADAIAAVLRPIAAGGLLIRSIADASAKAEPIRPLDVGPRLAIVPAESFTQTDARTLGLHMGLAFGTGRHETTRLCLAWLEREMTAVRSVLDYGTGSGVLALAALKLGASRATAVDNDPQALVATRRNAELNGLEDRLRITQPGEMTGRFDLILANILAGPLIALRERFAARQPAGGRIVLSGILVTQLDEVQSRYRERYEDFARDSLGEWGLLTARRRPEV